MPDPTPDNIADRTEHLLARWHDESISSVEIDELTELLGRDPAARRALTEGFLFAEAVGHALGPPAAPEERAGPSRFRFRPALAGLAAALVVGLAIWAVARPGPTSAPGSPGRVVASTPPAAAPALAPAATLVEVSGVVTVAGSESAQGAPVTGGQALAAGQVVRTGGDDGRAVVLYADGTRLELAADTVVRLPALAAGDAGATAAFGKHAALTAGVLRADVARQPAGRPMLLTTPQAEVRVLGTRFTSAITATATRVDLDEGRLHVLRTADRRAVEFDQGKYVVATATPAADPPAPHPLPTYLAHPRFAFKAPAEAVALSPDGRTLALGRNAGEGPNAIELWDVSAAGAPRLTLALPTGRPPTRSLAFAPDGTRLAAGYRQAHADLWDLAARRVALTWDVGEMQPTSLAFSRDGAWLAASLDRPNGVPYGGVAWSTVSGAEAPAPPQQGKLRPVLALPGRDALLAGERSGRLLLWDPPTGAPRGDFDGLPRPTGLGASADGRYLAVAGDDRVLVLDAATGEIRQVFSEPGRRFRPVALSPDGRLLAAGAGDGTVTVWRVADGTPVTTLRADRGGLRWAAFTPDGRTLITGAFAKPAKLWDVPAAR